MCLLQCSEMSEVCVVLYTPKIAAKQEVCSYMIGQCGREWQCNRIEMGVVHVWADANWDGEDEEEKDGQEPNSVELNSS